MGRRARGGPFHGGHCHLSSGGFRQGTGGHGGPELCDPPVGFPPPATHPCPASWHTTLVEGGWRASECPPSQRDGGGGQRARLGSGHGDDWKGIRSCPAPSYGPTWPQRQHLAEKQQPYIASVLGEAIGDYLDWTRDNLIRIILITVVIILVITPIVSLYDHGVRSSQRFRSGNWVTGTCCSVGRTCS